jgi:hypothetical protein
MESEEEVPTAGSVYVVGRKKLLKFYLRKRKSVNENGNFPTNNRNYII